MKSVRFVKALSKAAYDLKKERFETLVSVKDDMEEVDYLMKVVKERYGKENYQRLEEKVKKIKEKIRKKFDNF